MKDEQTLIAIADYLVNALDRDSDEDMSGFLVEAFNIPAQVSNQLVEAFVQRYSTAPIVIENEAVELISRFLESH